MQFRTVAHYRILRQIGCGGMGVVYQAEDLHLPRLVAIKFLHPDLAGSSDALERFLNEARATCILNHPNIATVYEFDRQEDEPFLVMEYLPGGTLRERIRNLARSGQRCGASELRTWARQLAAGLAHAHQHRIIHRDIKPANVMFAESGALKLTDFGLARWRPSGPTHAGLVVGTAAYMSPEQAAGRTVDARSDIYSLGVVLYELAAGRLPNGKPEPLEALRPDLPPGLAGLIRSALERRVEDRCQSADEMCRALEALDGTARASGAETVTLRAMRPSVRRRLAYAAAGLALLVPSLWVAPRAAPSLFYRLPAEKKVALLPFEIPGADADTRAFAEGVQDVVAASLASVRRDDFWIVPARELRLQGALDREAARRAFGVNLVAHGEFDARSRRLHLAVARASDGRTLARRTVWLDPLAPATAQQEVLSSVAAMLQVPATLPADSGTRTDPDAEDLYLQARGFLQRHDGGRESVDHAIRQFQLALEKNPRFPRAYAGLAGGYLRRYQGGRDPEDLKQSEAMALRAAALDAAMPEVYTTLGGVYYEQGRYPEAVAQLRRARELDSGNPDIYDLLAGAYDAMGQAERAETTYRDAVRLRPSYWVSHAHLGSYYFRHTRYQEALHEYEIVTTLAPDNAANFAYWGGILLAAGRLEDARKALERSLELKPNAAAYSNLGTVYYAQHRYGEAAASYARATQDSADYRIWGNLGDALERTGAAEQARGAYRQALALAERRLQANPSDPAVLGSSAVFWAKLRDAAQARACLERALLAAPARPEVLFKAARVHALTGNPPAAVQALRAALQAGYSLQAAASEPDLASLADNPQYRQLAKEFALTGETR